MSGFLSSDFNTVWREAYGNTAFISSDVRKYYRKQHLIHLEKHSHPRSFWSLTHLVVSNQVTFSLVLKKKQRQEKKLSQKYQHHTQTVSVYKCYFGNFRYSTISQSRQTTHVMCNIRCTSREKREDASPQKPQSSAKVHGDTNTLRHTWAHDTRTKGTDTVALVNFNFV